MYTKKRWLAILLIVGLILSAVPQSFSDNARKAHAQQNDGTSVLSDDDEAETEEYKPVYDIGDLYEIRNDLSANYILMNDIDMSEDTAEGGDYDRGNGWEPIQNFTGDFNGNGHRIIGIHIFGDMNGKNVGLFGSASGSFTNLGIVDCDINVNNTKYAGGLVGYAGYDSKNGYTYSNCYITGNIQVQTSDWSYVGGIIGYMYDDYGSKGIYVVKQCYANCKITENDNIRIGGIIGYVDEEYYLQMESVYFAGNVGENYAFVGDLYHSYGGDYYFEDGYTSCYYLENSAKQGSYGHDDDTYGIVKLTESQMKNHLFFTGFDFAEVWEIDPYCVSYLYPQLRSNRQVRAQQITITKMPEKLEYEQGDTVDFTDGEIEILYENKTKQILPITMDMISGIDTSEVGRQTAVLSYAGSSVELTIEVKGVEVTGLMLNDVRVDINALDTFQLQAMIAPTNASHQELIWESSDPDVATVSETGLVLGLTRGKATITVYSYDKAKSASCVVNVLVPCVELTLSDEKIQIDQGETYALEAKMKPLQTTDKVTWTCRKTSVATVDEDGKVTGVGPGTAEIIATTDSGVTATCQVNVTLPCTELSLSSSHLNLWVTQSTKLVAVKTPSNSTDKLTWTSDNQTVVQVDQYGNVRAVGEGEATITVSTASGISATCMVNVIKKTIVQLNMMELNLAVSSSKQLVATLTPATSEDTLTWSSSDEKVVKVDQRGIVKAVGAGIARITVTTSSGESDFCIVTVVGTSQGNSSNNTVKKPANNGNTVKIVRMATKIKSVKQIKKTSALVKFSNYKKGQYFEITIKQNGKKAITKTITARSSYRIKKLKSKKRYTISVRSYSVVNGKKYYGSRSAKKKFKTK